MGKFRTRRLILGIAVVALVIGTVAVRALDERVSLIGVSRTGKFIVVIGRRGFSSQWFAAVYKVSTNGASVAMEGNCDFKPHGFAVSDDGRAVIASRSGEAVLLDAESNSVCRWHVGAAPVKRVLITDRGDRPIAFNVADKAELWTVENNDAVKLREFDGRLDDLREWPERVVVVTKSRCDIWSGQDDKLRKEREIQLASESTDAKVTTGNAGRFIAAWRRADITGRVRLYDTENGSKLFETHQESSPESQVQEVLVQEETQTLLTIRGVVEKNAGNSLLGVFAFGATRDSWQLPIQGDAFEFGFVDDGMIAVFSRLGNALSVSFVDLARRTVDEQSLGEYPHRLAISQDHRSIAGSSFDGKIQVWTFDAKGDAQGPVFTPARIEGK